MEDDDYVFGEGDWSLPFLKVLVYKCIIPSKSYMRLLFKKSSFSKFFKFFIHFFGAIEVIDHVIKACPKLEELHIGRRNDDLGVNITCTYPVPDIPPIDFFSTIKFQHLTRFTITGLNLTSGSFLPAVSINSFNISLIIGL